MRQVNLMALTRGLAAVPSELQAGFEAQLCERDEPLGSIKPHEAACVMQLTDDLRRAGAEDLRVFEGFAYSFRIPQISSEFDLLRVARTSVLNVELKAEDVGEERVRRQLERNRYYLGPLERRIHAFTYVLRPRAMYELDEGAGLVRVGMERLLDVLRSMDEPYDGQLEGLFRASDYLVSPLNDTREFLEGCYFLTNHQEQIKTSFLKGCAGVGEPPVHLVYGSSGTGKSLLLYDLARSLHTDKPACVVHCGVLAQGHARLNEGQRAFRVVSAKGSERLDFSVFGAILVDEAQRMWPAQLRGIVAAARDAGLPLFLSLDQRQMLGQCDEAHDVEKVVRAAFPHVRVWRLSRRIRTNRGLTGFIRALFGLRGHRDTVHTRHVKICYATDAFGAFELVKTWRACGYEHIRLGVGVPSELACKECPTTNEVVGQEFDRVVMAVGPGFAPDGSTSRDEAIYREHVFQGLTRARSDIALVVYDNPQLLMMT